MGVWNEDIMLNCFPNSNSATGFSVWGCTRVENYIKWSRQKSHVKHYNFRIAILNLQKFVELYRL